MPPTKTSSDAERNSMFEFFGDANTIMADVSGKAVNFRRAIAVGYLSLNAEAIERIVSGTMPKGDPIPQAEFAGISAAKKTSELLPLCHPLSLDQVLVRVVVEHEKQRLMVACCVSARANTGVEMEALVGTQVGLLTLYDMIKPVDPALIINDIRLVSKEGGKKGNWLHPIGVPPQMANQCNLTTPASDSEKAHKSKPANPKVPNGMTAMVVTVSDRCASAEREDRSGPLLVSMLEQLGLAVRHHAVVPDEIEAISAAVKHGADELRVNLVVTTGGTGAAPRDVTPDALLPLCHRILPGYGERLRIYGANSLPQAWLSRSFAGVRNDTLVLTLPGSTGGVRDGITAVADIIPDTLMLIRGHGCSMAS